MFSAINRVLENISVRTKLAMGFGVVLVLTVLIATSGWSGISGLNFRIARITNIAKLNDLSREVLISRQSFTVQPDAEKAGTIFKRLEALDQHLAVITPDFLAAVNKADLNKADKAAEAYRV